MSKKKILSVLWSIWVKEFLQSRNMKHIWLAWSMQKWIQDNNSDIDIVYEFDEEQELCTRWPIDGEIYLQKLFDRKIDCIDKDYIKPRAKQSILSSMQAIW